MDYSTLRDFLDDTKSSLSFETTNRKVPIRFLDNCELPISFEPRYVDRDVVARGVLSLTRLPVSVRQDLVTPIYRACLQSFEDCSYDFESPQAQLDWESEYGGNFSNPKAPSHQEDVWKLVKFSQIYLGKRVGGVFDGQYFVSIRGSTAWDSEHGIALFFNLEGEFVETGDLNR